MITFRRILFPVDFSERNVAVVPAVKAMAKRFGSELVILHIVDLPGWVVLYYDGGADKRQSTVITTAWNNVTFTAHNRSEL